MPEDPEETREIFRGSLLRVEVARWPDREREIVRHPGAAAVVALTTGDRVVLVRQLREAAGEELLEIPAGILDVEGEPPRDTARRELREETGYRTDAVEPLGRIHTSPGFTDERIELFLARAEREGRPEPGIEVVTLPFAEAVAAVEEGSITDAKTVVGLLLADRRGLLG